MTKKLMVKEVLDITTDTFLYLGINPAEVVEYIENKEASIIRPCDVSALRFLKRHSVSS